jgi:hypothetical protein
MSGTDKGREIEARLHRSLIGQVRVPKLDRSFDAGVWARIEAEQSAPAAAVHPALRRSGASRWLIASNVIGLAVAALLVVIFGLRMFSGGELGVSLPEVTAAQSGELADIITWTVSGASLLFGLMFTPLGRWLRSEFT